MSMKKDGIQTRNRKMSSKSKKSKKCSMINDFLRPLDKPFTSFTAHNLASAMPPSMPHYMTGMQPTPSHHSSTVPSAFSGPALPSGFSFAPSSLPQSFSNANTFSNISPNGLNLTSSGMIGAMA